jgi:hypothetical protein
MTLNPGLQRRRGLRFGATALLVAGVLLTACGGSPSSNASDRHHHLRRPLGGVSGFGFPATTTTIPLSPTRLAALNHTWCRTRPGSWTLYGTQLPIAEASSGPGPATILGIKINRAETWELWKAGAMNLLEVTVLEPRKPVTTTTNKYGGFPVPPNLRIVGLWARGIARSSLGCALSRTPTG